MRVRILLWGAGTRTKIYIQQGFLVNCDIVAIVDSFFEQHSFLGYSVIRPSQVKDYLDKVDYIVISSRFFNEIIETMVELGVPLNKIIITDHIIESPYTKYYEKTKEVLPSIYEYTKNGLLKTVKLNERDFSDDSTIFNDDRFTNIEYKNDYFRYRTFEFVAEEILAARVEGSVAELGVFKGLFSALINEKFADRKIYLFDTFEGFDVAEAESEIKLGRCDETFVLAHKDTSIEIMLHNLPNPGQAVVCKGLFPESVTDDARAEKYAFVSIDVDFEESTYQGLQFFYPRLTEGGYIFIHDYNTYYLDGIKRAVERYEETMGFRLKKVPLADRAGTLIIMK